MIFIVIANIIALVASLLMVYSGLLKKAKEVVYVQSVQITLLIASNIILGGIPGAIVNAINLLRNIIFYNDKLNNFVKIILTLITLILGYYFNNLGIIGYLPIVAGLSYLWLMDIKNPKSFKYLNISNLILWFIYDLYIYSFTSAFFDMLTVITNFIAIINLNKDKKIHIIKYNDEYAKETMKFVNDSMHYFINKPYKKREDLININDYYIKKGGIFYLALYNNTVIGTIGLENQGNIGIVKRFYVEKKFQKLGIGNRLLKKIEKFIEEKTNIKKTILVCNKMLKNAHRFYHKHGYRKVKKLEYEIKVDNMDEYYCFKKKYNIHS